LCCFSLTQGWGKKKFFSGKKTYFFYPDFIFFFTPTFFSAYCKLDDTNRDQEIFANRKGICTETKQNDFQRLNANFIGETFLK